MTIAELELEAVVLFDMWGLGDWTFEVGNRCRALGVCFYRRKVIQVTQHHIENDPYRHVMDTLKHEVAHAVTWNRYGKTVAPHGPEWKTIAALVGCEPEDCKATASTELGLSKPPGKFYSVCPGCSYRFEYYRKPKIMLGRYCTPCGPEKGLLTVKENK